MPEPVSPPAATPVRDVLAAAVAALGGEQRDGQIAMADAVAASFAGREHLLVQAGTGTGKSLGYLVPALLHDERVVVATATLALQHQLVERDIPRLMEAVGELPGVDATYAVLKGRSNYACLHRIREGVPDDQGVLVEVPTGSQGAEVLKLRAWAEEEAKADGTGERDNAPRHTDRVWRQVSVNHRECLGATKCPFAQECFAERAREKAQRSHLIVTNHSLLAIDAIEGVPMIPDYDVVVVDEAHEVVSRVTQAATDELTVLDVERAARRSQRHVGESDAADRLAEAADALADAVAAASPGRFDTPARPAGRGPRAGPRRRARLPLGVPQGRRRRRRRPDPGPRDGPGRLRQRRADGRRRRRRRAVARRGGRPVTRPAARRAAAGVGPDARQAALRQDRRLHLGHPDAGGRLHPGRDVRGAQAGRAPGALGGRAVLLGGRRSSSAVEPVETPDDRLPWRGIDVGSPFDYGQQAILYVAAHLPPPGRDGLGERQLDEIVELVDAAEGRTLGLFSSRRAAERAAEVVRERLPHLTTLAQGEAQLPELAKQFVGDPHTCLFGTLSLWQGLDVPGDTCQLVIIDRIPFPRPDDPLMSARQRAADQAGGNGFMQVAATHAALLLAQGTGRLIRTTTDKGVVAVLDPRLVTARYGAFLRASLPPMWATTDPALVRKALGRLSGTPGAQEAPTAPGR